MLGLQHFTVEMVNLIMKYTLCRNTFSCLFAELLWSLGHQKARETVRVVPVKDAPLSFRKSKAASGLKENLTPLSHEGHNPRLSPFSGPDKPPSAAVTPLNSVGKAGRGTKRRGASANVTPGRKVLQLHSYFSRVNTE